MGELVALAEAEAVAESVAGAVAVRLLVARAEPVPLAVFSGDAELEGEAVPLALPEPEAVAERVAVYEGTEATSTPSSRSAASKSGPVSGGCQAALEVQDAPAFTDLAIQGKPLSPSRPWL